MSSEYLIPTISIDPEQPRLDHASSIKEFMQTCGLTPYNDKNIEMAHQIIDDLRWHNAQTSDQTLSGNHGNISNYAIMREQGFNGMKDFMESHGLKLWNDDDVQTAHQIIDKMREFDEEQDELSTFAEDSDNEIAHGERIEDDTERIFQEDNSYGVLGLQSEGNVLEDTSLNVLQFGGLYDGEDHIQEGLEDDIDGGRGGYSWDVAEDSNTPDFDGAGSYDYNDDSYDGGEYGGYDDDGDDYGFDDYEGDFD